MKNPVYKVWTVFNNEADKVNPLVFYTVINYFVVNSITKIVQSSWDDFNKACECARDLNAYENKRSMLARRQKVSNNK